MAISWENRNEQCDNYLFTNPLYYDFNLYHCVPAVLYSITEQKAKIHEISSKLKELLDTDSDEKVTVFTDNKALIELATQINRMLEDRQKVKLSIGGLKWHPKRCYLTFPRH